MIRERQQDVSQLYVLRSPQEERRFRLEVLDQNGRGAKERFLSTFSAAYPEGSESIGKAFEFACQIDYDHVGLSSEAYLAHPLRVTEMVMSHVGPRREIDVIIALLHNLLEVSAISALELKDRFGPVVGESIVNLTVDRKRQDDPAYKRDYYQRIENGYNGAGAVKVFDKLDNVFVLCLNGNAKIRTDYLDEIEQYVIPLARQCVPAVADYFKAAVAEARIFGHHPR